MARLRGGAAVDVRFIFRRFDEEYMRALGCGVAGIATDV